MVDRGRVLSGQPLEAFTPLHPTPAQQRSPWLTAATPLAHLRPPTTAGLQDSNPVLADVFNAVEALFSAPTPVNDPSAPEVASNPVFADVANAVEALFSAPTPVNDPSAPEVAVVGGFGKSMTNAAFGVEALASATTAGRATRNAPVAQSPLGHSLADAFFGTRHQLRFHSPVHLVSNSFDQTGAPRSAYSEQ